ncbi:MAG: TIGR00297 family protein [Cyanobacterium sp.]
MNINLDWSNSWLVGIIINTVLITLAFILPKKLLTVAGYLNAWLLGVIVWGCLSWQGYLVVLFYFFVGSSVTRIGMKEKQEQGIAEKRDGVRGPENVWGSALIATFCALGYFFFPSVWQPLMVLGYVASFATKLSDTCASEVGKAYGKRTFLITTFKPVPRGTEGAVSLEGTLAGVVASVIIAYLASVLGLISLVGILICIISAFVATNFESFVGATFQDNFDWLTNEVVNIINTFMGAIVAIALGCYFIN